MSGADQEAPLSLCPHCKSIFRSGFSRCPADGTELTELVEDPFVGQVFAGRYAIEALAGQGAMGRVYRARHTRMSKRFAVKIMFGDLASDATMRARFQSEAEASSRLDHPNVVSVVDFGDTVGGLVYMVMDYVEGQSLARIIEQTGPMPEPRARILLRQIALGLQHAHDRGLVHRDLKTDNVVVVDNDGDEIARVIDFGIAMFADAAPGPAKLTAIGVVIGTPAYMSPEQACGEKLDHRSDLFSLGVVAYELLAGRKPFDGHPFEIARQNISSTPPRIHERAPLALVSPELEAIVFKLLAKSRDDRFASAQAMVDALDGVGLGELLGGEPTLRLEAPPRATSVRPRVPDVDLSAERVVPARGGSRWMGWVAAALVVSAGAAAALWWRDRSPAVSALAESPAAELSPAVLSPAPDPSPLAGTASEAASGGTAPVAVVAPAETDEGDPDEPPADGVAVASGEVSGERGGRARGARRTPAARAARAAVEDEEAGVSASELTARYRLVAARVNLIGKQRGERAAAAFEDKFLRATNSYNAAIRDSRKRRDAYEELGRLQDELSRL